MCWTSSTSRSDWEGKSKGGYYTRSVAVFTHGVCWNIVEHVKYRTFLYLIDNVTQIHAMLFEPMSFKTCIEAVMVYQVSGSVRSGKLLTVLI